MWWWKMSDRTRRNLLDIIKKRAKKPFVKKWKTVTGDPGDSGDPEDPGDLGHSKDPGDSEVPGKKLMITA